MLQNSRACFFWGFWSAAGSASHTHPAGRPQSRQKYIQHSEISRSIHKLMKIHLILGYPDTSEFLRSRIAIIARIPGYIYPDISPDTIHQPAIKKDINIVQKSRKINKTHKAHAPKFQGVFFLRVLKRRRQCITHAPCWKTQKRSKVYSKFWNIQKYTKNPWKSVWYPDTRIHPNSSDPG